MSSLEQEASDRKAKLSQLRAKRGVLETSNPSEELKVENGDSNHDNKRPKLVQRNFLKTDEEESAITKLIIDNDDTVETVAKNIEKEILLKYNKLSKLDWSELGLEGEVEEQRLKKQIHSGEVFDEYREKLKLQELKLLKLTNERISLLRKEIGADKGK